MRAARPGRALCLIVSNNFPPTIGGAGEVYAALAAAASGRIRILCASRSYLTGKPIEGWREHDRAEPETGSDHANRVRLEDLIAKLEAKAASSTFPHEAASLRAKVGELRRKLEAAP